MPAVTTIESIDLPNQYAYRTRQIESAFRLPAPLAIKIRSAQL
jgi:hypothetical protein